MSDEAEQKCPKCGQSKMFDISGIHGGCEGEVYEIHCPECGHYFDPRIHCRKGLNQEIRNHERFL